MCLSLEKVYRFETAAGGFSRYNGESSWMRRGWAPGERGAVAIHTQHLRGSGRSLRSASFPSVERKPEAGSPFSPPDRSCQDAIAARSPSKELKRLADERLNIALTCRQARRHQACAAKPRTRGICYQGAVLVADAGLRPMHEGHISMRTKRGMEGKASPHAQGAYSGHPMHKGSIPAARAGGAGISRLCASTRRDTGLVHRETEHKPGISALRNAQVRYPSTIGPPCKNTALVFCTSAIILRSRLLPAGIQPLCCRGG